MGKHQTNGVFLTEEERTLLDEQTMHGSWSPREVIRAKILLLADLSGPNPLQDEEIAKQLGCSISSVAYRRKRFADTRSIEDTIFDKARSGRPTIIDGAIDAHMTTIACSSPPEGHCRWTLRMIKDRLITLNVIDSISHTTVGDALKKKKLNLG
jgi:transposase